MKAKRFLSRVLFIGLVLALASGVGLSLAQGPLSAQEEVGTAFTYQGRLTDGGSPANGEYDFRFELYDAASDGAQVGSMVGKENTAVTDGLFTVELDFGSDIFTGEARYLEIGVRPGASGGLFTTLLPRQALTPAPYALALPGLWTQQNITSTNLIGGYSGNSVSAGVAGATISGGGSSNFPNQVTAGSASIGGGYGNTAAGDSATVGGGGRNTSSGSRATVGGGHYNTASGQRATVGGGYSNEARSAEATVGGGYNNTASGERATVGGGYSNEASGLAATIPGGYDNTAIGEYAAIGGGLENAASGGDATVGGGAGNTASQTFATVGGGANNTASSYAATIPGGYENTADGDYSFAAGRFAKANNEGCFVWGDSTFADVVCSADNRWVARASGGVYFYTNSGLTSGMYLSAGGSSWNAVSDRERKENFEPVDNQELLARLAETPVTTWNYKAQDPSIRHIGPMAQDFNVLIEGLGGEGEDYINTLDADGVALAAIQGLYAQNQALEAENTALQQQVDDLEARVVALEATPANSTAPARPAQSGLLPGVGVLLAGLGLVWVARRGGER